MTSTEEKLIQLNREVVQLYQEEKYSEAIKVGIQALDMGKNKLGSRHPNIATAINNLALLYDKIGYRTRAAPLLQWNQQLFANKSWEAQAV